MTVEHELEEIDAPPALEPAYTTLLDAHEQWHDAFDAYHEPRVLRRHVDTLIQSLRNVTFRLQSAKGECPLAFDPWYERWQALMKSDPKMKWLHDARTEVVKRSGIQPASFALVRVIDSYNEPTETLLRLPPTVSTPSLFDRARVQIPEELRPYVALEILRRWTTPGLKNQELLLVFAHCFHVLDALLLDAVTVFAGSYSDPAEPAAFLATVELPRCMLMPASLIRVMQEADTGKYLTYSPQAMERDETQVAEAVDRYGLPKEPIVLPDDVMERARVMHGMARNVFKHDGHHYPFIHFRTVKREWSIASPMMSNKREKFIMWHQFAIDAARHGYDALVSTTEVWMAPTHGTPRPYESAEDSPERREALVTFAEEASGRRIILTSEITRVVGKPFLKHVEENSSPAPEEMAFVDPVRRVWRELARTGDGAEGT